MSSQNVLALDIGSRRIGLALAKAETGLPQPFGVIEVNEAVLSNLQKVVNDNSVNVVVAGLPRNLEGDDTAQTAFVRDFVTKLQPLITPKIQLMDEALTSIKAEEELKARGKNYQKADIDTLSATLILEDFLNVKSD